MPARRPHEQILLLSWQGRIILYLLPPPRRQWVAEENRHGDLMNKYCYLSGKVNMRAVEVTIQNLIGSGMNPKTDNNPYNGFVYTSFQVRAGWAGEQSG